MDKKELPEGKRLSLEQEERLAKLFKGSRTPRSGGGNWVKGDVLSGGDTEGWFVEAKTTVKPSLSYSVHKSILDKMDHERSEMRKPFAALAFTLGEEREDYFVVNKRTMSAILSQQKELAELLESVKEELSSIEKKMSDIGRDGRAPTQIEQTSYTAHRAEKVAFIQQLEKLL